MEKVKERVLFEKSELDDKIKKLKIFVFDENRFDIAEEQEMLLKVQLKSMETYSECLEQRIKSFDKLIKK